MATQSDGGGWLSVWSVDGTPLTWSTNPVPEGTRCRDDGSYDHCFQSVVVVPGTTLIAYTWTNVSQTELTMTVFDSASGSELTSVEIAEGAQRPILLQANRVSVVISRYTYDFEEVLTFLPILVFDLATGSLSELPIEGLATIAG
ncbi:MAG: hypothetical protein HZA58_01250 [Acidimicrobiia bacterium]|nr:hypothetical protein [Acidimicrobiia bacterium]